MHDHSSNCDMGVFAHVCPSALFAVAEEKDTKSALVRYRVVAKNVQLYAEPPEEGSRGRVLGALHKGNVIEASSRCGKWIQCDRGWMELYTEREVQAVEISFEQYALHGRGGFHGTNSSCIILFTQNL